MTTNDAKINKRLHAYNLVLSGMHPQRIADEHGVNLATVYRWFQSAKDYINEQAINDVIEQRNLEAARLNELMSSIWLQAAGGDLKAISTVLDVSNARVKLLGLAVAPVQVVNSTVKADVKTDMTVTNTLTDEEQAVLDRHYQFRSDTDGMTSDELREYVDERTRKYDQLRNALENVGKPLFLPQESTPNDE